MFKRVGVINIAFSDHYPIYGILHGFATRPNKHNTITTRPWNDRKINDFIADLKQAPWSLIDSSTDVDDMCSAWESLMKSLIGRHFPLKKKRQVLPSNNYRTEIDKIVVDGKELIGKHDIASSLNDYFTTIASSLLPSQQSHDSPVELQQDGLTSISNYRFKCRAVSENDVFKVLRTIYISKATGEDSIPA